MFETDPLIHAIRNCTLYPQLMMVQKALVMAGYGDVELGRRLPGQKSKSGGHELTCVLTTGPVPLRVLVKFYGYKPRIRTFDELAGCVVRHGADMGLVVSPYKTTASAKGWQGWFKGKLRMDLIDGDALAELIRRSGFATRPDGSPNYSFLEELEIVAEKMADFGKAAK